MVTSRLYLLFIVEVESEMCRLGSSLHIIVSNYSIRIKVVQVILLRQSYFSMIQNPLLNRSFTSYRTLDAT